MAYLCNSRAVQTVNTVNVLCDLTVLFYQFTIEPVFHRAGIFAVRHSFIKSLGLGQRNITVEIAFSPRIQSWIAHDIQQFFPKTVLGILYQGKHVIRAAFGEDLVFCVMMMDSVTEKYSFGEES